jgi:hypothetical protein
MRSATVRVSVAYGRMIAERSPCGVRSADVMSVLTASSPSVPRNFAPALIAAR